MRMLRLTNLSVPLDYTEETLFAAVLKKCGLQPDQLLSLHIIRRSVDARDKSNVHFVLSLHLKVRNEPLLLKKCRFLSPAVSPAPADPVAARFSRPPLVVGAGPSGLFAALTLARAGANPVLVERGHPVEKRIPDVEKMSAEGVLDPESNVQFGEGGAGAFSDGKLTCGIKSPWLHTVLETFVSHGAPEEILFDAMPHIGTDRLRGVVASIRSEITALGGKVLFETKLEKLLIRGSHLEGAVLSRAGESHEFLSDTVLLCIGHSARDTVNMLFSQGVRMSQKPFAMGVRIEHPRLFIDQAQYGAFAGHPALGAASYKLVCHTPDSRGVYTFCMCPGGYVIAAASQPGGIVVNGMSFHARNAENSNSALLVGICTDDFGDDHPLAGMILQRQIEKAAYLAGNSSFRAPCQRVEDFFMDRATRSFGEVQPSYRPGITPADLRAVFPSFITEDLKKGIRAMNSQLPGFAMPDAVLTAPETRSSSPVRILRNETGESESIAGLFPVGEGAGYAGGIVSAAIDGIIAARKAMEKSCLL